MERVVLGLGGNIGNVRNSLEKSIDLIAIKIGNVVSQSSIYKTEAWGVKNQPFFLNQIIIVETELDVETILSTCLSIEKKMGRDRVNSKKWTERIIDIDILFFNNEIIDLPHLKIPHPHIHERNFVLVPLVELIPNYVHPFHGKRLDELQKICKDKMRVIKLLD